MLVTFENIRPTYYVHESIIVIFRATQPKVWRPKVGDVIVICNSDLTCMSSIPITEEFIEQFKGAELFYVVYDQKALSAVQVGVPHQFVYLANGLIKGRSIPFTIEYVPIKPYESQPWYSKTISCDSRKVATLPLSKEYFFDAIEKGLLKQNEKLTSSLRLTEDKIENKILSNEEILNENARLTKALESATKELVELKDEVKDLKSLSSDLIKKLSISERKVTSYPSSGLYYEREKGLSQPVQLKHQDFLRSLPPNLHIFKGLPLSKPEVGSKIVEDSIVKDYSKKLYKTTVREEDVISYPSYGLY